MLKLATAAFLVACVGCGGANQTTTSASTPSTAATTATTATPATTAGAAPVAIASGRANMKLKRMYWEATRSAPASKYPTPVVEKYAIDATAGLHYSAYFQNMPINFNHTDSTDWHDDAAITALWAAAPSSADTCKSQPATADAIALEFTTAAGDVGCRIQRNDPAWAAFVTAFDRFIATFEAATGRPRTSATLPQSR